MLILLLILTKHEGAEQTEAMCDAWDQDEEDREDSRYWYE